MSVFKEQIAKDLDVFINADEFADWHLLNDKKIKCIIDTNENKTYSYNRGSSFDDGMFNCDLMITYKYSDYPSNMIAGVSIIEFDNVTYEVANFSVVDGLVTVKLNSKVD